MEILHTNQNHQAMLLIKTAMATAVLVLPRINLTTTAVATKTTTKKCADVVGSLQQLTNNVGLEKGVEETMKDLLQRLRTDTTFQ